ncbi:MAG: transcription elongation factor GreA [Coriobacteriia bacterium]|jgi:transcription elongation factor GreA|nr:transcription elongation factor GreA [Coriobacteriia bacterium]MDR2714399.1 transcription elongation factor GreA [Coriobacteriales bacterium]
MQKDIVLTPEGREKLEAELQHLETDRRAEVGERIRIAREFGDISENSEYDDAKNEQAWLESRITEVTQILANATIAEAPKRSNKVSVGNVVTVEDGSGAERVFTIVGAAEVDVEQGRISNESPVGSALLGSKKGDTVTIEGPTGKQTQFTILKIGR